MYKRVTEGWLKHGDFILLDLIAFQLAFLGAYCLRFGLSWPYARQDYMTIGLLMSVLDVTAAIAFNTMHNVLKRTPQEELGQTVQHCVLVFAGTTVCLFAVQIGDVYSRLTLFYTLLLHIAIGYGTRLLWKRALRRRGLRESSRSVLLAVTECRAKELLHRRREYPQDGWKIAGLVLLDRDAEGETVDGVPVVANLDGAARFICRAWIDEVMIYPDGMDSFPDALMRQCDEMCVPVHLVLAFLGGEGHRRISERVAGYQVLTTVLNYAGPLQLFLKRCLDVIGGLVGSVLALLVIAVVGPFIKKESPGPILFRQERIGRNGKRFQMLKLRSMYPDADARKQELMRENRVTDGMMFKLDWDPRIIGNRVLPDGTRKTGVGEFIRRTSLDEFPQFFNVLRGDMSLVGTRPPTVDEWDRYELHHRARLAVKPGITGMWQVSGRSEITDFEEVVRLDVQYIAQWSLWLDIKILLKTVGAVIRRKGAM